MRNAIRPDIRLATSGCLYDVNTLCQQCNNSSSPPCRPVLITPPSLPSIVNFFSDVFLSFPPLTQDMRWVRGRCFHCLHIHVQLEGAWSKYKNNFSTPPLSYQWCVIHYIVYHTTTLTCTSRRDMQFGEQLAHTDRYLPSHLLRGSIVCRRLAKPLFA
jgi:hypothetical protein